MFETTASQAEQRDGKLVSIVRIDETILNSAPPGRWCVEDGGGKWAELQGKDGSTGLFDDQPSETRGSYGFKPRSVMMEAGAVPHVAVPEMSVAEASTCVQENLNRVGFNAGPVDGQMGRRTFEAELRFASAQDGQSYLDLSTDTADGARSSGSLAAMVAKPATLGQMQTREGFCSGQRASSSGMIAAHLLTENPGLASLAHFGRGRSPRRYPGMRLWVDATYFTVSRQLIAADPSPAPLGRTGTMLYG